VIGLVGFSIYVIGILRRVLCVSGCLAVWLYIRFVGLSTCQFVWLSGCLVVWLSGCLAVWLSGCLAIYQYIIRNQLKQKPTQVIALPGRRQEVKKYQ
jgi:hypothetical protein